MAIAVKTKNDLKILMGEQSTWGTALTAAANFNMATPVFGSVLDVDPTSIDNDVKIRLPNRSNTGLRTLDRRNIQHDYKGSSPKITLSGDAKYNDLAQLLYAVMQNVSEGALTPFEKTFTFPATQPDFTAGGGWFGSIIVEDDSASSVNKLIRDVICRKLTLTCDPESNQGRAQISAEMIGRGAPTLNLAQASGTNTAAPQEFYYFHDIKVFTGNGSTLAPVSIKIEIENNARPISVDGTTLGDFKTYALGSYTVKATLRVLYEANARAIQAVQGTTVDHSWVLSWGTVSTDGYLNFVLQAQPGPAPDVNEDEKTIDFNLTGIVSGGVGPLTVVMADGIDRAW